MKPLLMLCMLLMCRPIHAQEMPQPQLGRTIDSINKVVDSLMAKAPGHMRTLTKQLIQNEKPVEHKWNYSKSADRQLFYLQVAWTVDSTYFEEDYFVSNGKLIYTEEKEIYHMPHNYGASETGHWIEHCYFINDKLIHEHSQGHGKSETDDYDPEKETLKRFKIRRMILKQWLSGPDLLKQRPKQTQPN